jgi:hypothetical protein
MSVVLEPITNTNPQNCYMNPLILTFSPKGEGTQSLNLTALGMLPRHARFADDGVFEPRRNPTDWTTCPSG